MKTILISYKYIYMYLCLRAWASKLVLHLQSRILLQSLFFTVGLDVYLYSCLCNLAFEKKKVWSQYFKEEKISICFLFHNTWLN